MPPSLPDLTLGAALIDSARMLLQVYEEPPQASLRLAAVGAYYAAFLYLVHRKKGDFSTSQ